MPRPANPRPLVKYKPPKPRRITPKPDSAKPQEARWFREQRKALGLSQSQMGKALKLHSNTIARMERGDMAVSMRTRMGVESLLLVKRYTMDQRTLVAWGLQPPTVPDKPQP